MLGGQHFMIFTDHKSLTYALAKMSGPWMACQDRQLSYLAEQTAAISHIASEENFVPDTLFRLSPCCWCERAPQVFGGRLAGRQARILYTIRVGCQVDQAAVYAVPDIDQLLDFTTVT
jgi:hypothetical protein